MLKQSWSLFAALSLSVGASATSISGHYTWVNGTLTSNATVKTTGQPISLSVGTKTVTVQNVLVVGDAGTVISSGTAFEILEAGSQPFAGTFSASSASAFTDQFFGDASARRAVPIATSGTLSASIGYAAKSPDLHIYLPPCTLGSFTIRNGMDVFLGAEPASYSLALPTPGSTAAVGSVVFPAGNPPKYGVSFLAGGTTNISLSGLSTQRTCNVTGTTTGTGTDITSATLSFVCANP